MKQTYTTLFLIVFALMIVSCTPPQPVYDKLAGKEKARVVKQLDAIYDADQLPRQKLMLLIDQHGLASQEVKALWQVIERHDAANLLKVTKLLDKYGWLSAQDVGEKGNSALFLVIQHADRKTWEKYVPVMRDAVKRKHANAADLAKLEDRLALEQGKKQLYGTQLGRDKTTNRYYVFPIEDPDHLDARRIEMGLDSMRVYVSAWGIAWK